MSSRSQVFVCYSHSDREYLARLRIHLRPFEREGSVDVWADTVISTGQLWRREIRSAIDRAAVAILLISADFLASDFIAENELPPLLIRAQEAGVRIFPVVLKPCAFLETERLAGFQALNDPNDPLISLDEAQREALWHRLAVETRDAFGRVSEAGDSTVSYMTGTGSMSVGNWALEEVRQFIGEELADPSAVDEFYVYEYHHIDYLGFMPAAIEVFEDLEGLDEVLVAVTARLERAGWEGDGTLQLLWLPPFVGAGIEDTWGLLVWFVKQSNNGTAWLVSPVSLPFARLLAQN